MVKERSRKNYIPDRGDFVWLEFDPQSGHEQAGLRPALVISPLSYNDVVGLALVCPITSKVKGYPFEVAVLLRKVQGVVLSDQIKSFDWRARCAQFISKAPLSVVTEVLEKVRSIIA